MSDQVHGESPPDDSAARRNIEIKARIDDLAAAQATAQRVATDHIGTLAQVDTYFHCQQGRLKLREIIGQASELIWYERPNLAGPRESRFGLIQVENARQLKQDLEGLLGIWTIVEKKRDVYLYHNVRIHLDEVARLGTFLEFEAVIDEENDVATGQARLEFLCQQFVLVPDDFIAGSYSDIC